MKFINVDCKVFLENLDRYLEVSQISVFVISEMVMGWSIEMSYYWYRWWLKYMKIDEIV